MTRFLTLPWNALVVVVVLGCIACGVAQANNTAAIIQFINSITLTGRTITTDGNTSEDRALKWLVTENDPKYQFTPGSTYNNTRLAQRYALTTYFITKDGEGAASTLKRAQLAKISESYWPYFYSSQDNVTSLGNLFFDAGPYAGYVVGTIPMELGLLSSLRSIYLFLSGTLPTIVGKWTDLDTVRVACSSKDCKTTLPSSIGDWRNVRDVRLEGHNFTGSLPSTIGNWNNIERFSVYFTNFNGTLPTSIGNWTNMKSITLYDNLFTGVVPTFLAKTRSLDSIGLDNNKFSGSLPMGNWVNLTQFSVSNNSFTGTVVSSALANWENIVFIDMRNNNLTGTIPRNLCNDIVGYSSFNADCPNEVACWCCEGCKPPKEPCPGTDKCGTNNKGYILHRTLFSRCIERCTTSQLMAQWRLRKNVWKCGKCEST